MLLLGVGIGLGTMGTWLAFALWSTSGDARGAKIGWCVLELRRLRNELRDVADVDCDPQLAAAARSAHQIAAALQRAQR